MPGFNEGTKVAGLLGPSLSLTLPRCPVLTLMKNLLPLLVAAKEKVLFTLGLEKRRESRLGLLDDDHVTIFF